MNKDEIMQQIAIREKLALYIAFDAGSTMLELYHKHIKKTQKSLNDYVSQLDKDIEELARKSVQESFPTDNFYGEESAPINNHGDFEWIVDPIDGTNNYLRGLPLAGVQLAVTYKGEIMYGLIYRPMTQDYYYAKKGGGAHYTNKLTGENKILSVSKRLLGESFGIFDSKIGTKNNLATPLFNKLIDKIASLRVLGAAAYDIPAVAEGSVEFLLTGIAKKYDIAPGWLLVTEAGGQIYSPDGEVGINEELVIISNSNVRSELLEAING